MKQEPILSILNRIGEEPKTSIKEKILKENVNNELLKSVLWAGLNKFVTYGITIIPPYTKGFEGEGGSLQRTISKGLVPFAQGVLRGNKATIKLTQLLEGLSSDDAEVLERIIQRDLKIGIGITTVNKVWPFFIPDFNYMGADSFSPEKFDKIGWENGNISQIKENGLFASTEVTQEPTLHRSRKGLEIDLTGHFDRWFEVAKSYMRQNGLLDQGKGKRFDGEFLVLKEGSETEYEERSIGNGIVNKYKGGNFGEGEVSRIRYVVWDMVDLDNAYQGYDPTKYIDRFKAMNLMIKAVNNHIGIDLVRAVETKLVYTKEQAVDHFRSAVSRKLEGTILKAIDGVWQDGKHYTRAIKVKMFCPCELVITGSTESKVKGMLGSFTCESADGKLVVNVGSGYSDEQKKMYWENRDHYVGGIMTVQFCEIGTKSGSDIASLINPVFIEHRTDKDEADTLQRIRDQYQAKIDVGNVSGGKNS